MFVSRVNAKVFEFRFFTYSVLNKIRSVSLTNKISRNGELSRSSFSLSLSLSRSPSLLLFSLSLCLFEHLNWAFIGWASEHLCRISYIVLPSWFLSTAFITLGTLVHRSVSRNISWALEMVFCRQQLSVALVRRYENKHKRLPCLWRRPSVGSKLPESLSPLTSLCWISF